MSLSHRLSDLESGGLDTADHLVTVGVALTDDDLSTLGVVDDDVGVLGTPETATKRPRRDCHLGRHPR